MSEYHKYRDVPKKYNSLLERARNGSRKAAIRAFCLECVGWIPSEVKACTVPYCPLYPYRLGQGPSRRLECAQNEHD